MDRLCRQEQTMEQHVYHQHHVYQQQHALKPKSQELQQQQHKVQEGLQRLAEGEDSSSSSTAADVLDSLPYSDHTRAIQKLLQQLQEQQDTADTAEQVEEATAAAGAAQQPARHTLASAAVAAHGNLVQALLQQLTRQGGDTSSNTCPSPVICSSNAIPSSRSSFANSPSSSGSRADVFSGNSSNKTESSSSSVVVGGYRAAECSSEGSGHSRCVRSPGGGASANGRSSTEPDVDRAEAYRKIVTLAEESGLRLTASDDRPPCIAARSSRTATGSYGVVTPQERPFLLYGAADGDDIHLVLRQQQELQRRQDQQQQQRETKQQVWQHQQQEHVQQQRGQQLERRWRQATVEKQQDYLEQQQRLHQLEHQDIASQQRPGQQQMDDEEKQNQQPLQWSRTLQQQLQQQQRQQQQLLQQQLQPVDIHQVQQLQLQQQHLQHQFQQQRHPLEMRVRQQQLPQQAGQPQWLLQERPPHQRLPLQEQHREQNQLGSRMDQLSEKEQQERFLQQGLSLHWPLHAESEGRQNIAAAAARPAVGAPTVEAPSPKAAAAGNHAEQQQLERLKLEVLWQLGRLLQQPCEQPDLQQRSDHPHLQAQQQRKQQHGQQVLLQQQQQQLEEEERRSQAQFLEEQRVIEQQRYRDQQQHMGEQQQQQQRGLEQESSQQQGGGRIRTAVTREYEAARPASVQLQSMQQQERAMLQRLAHEEQQDVVGEDYEGRKRCSPATRQATFHPNTTTSRTPCQRHENAWRSSLSSSSLSSSSVSSRQREDLSMGQQGSPLVEQQHLVRQQVLQQQMVRQRLMQQRQEMQQQFMEQQHRAVQQLLEALGEHPQQPPWRGQKQPPAPSGQTNERGGLLHAEPRGSDMRSSSTSNCEENCGGMLVGVNDNSGLHGTDGNCGTANISNSNTSCVSRSDASACSRVRPELTMRSDSMPSALARTSAVRNLGGMQQEVSQQQQISQEQRQLQQHVQQWKGAKELHHELHMGLKREEMLQEEAARQEMQRQIRQQRQAQQQQMLHPHLVHHQREETAALQQLGG